MTVLLTLHLLRFVSSKYEYLKYDLKICFRCIICYKLTSHQKMNMDGEIYKKNWKKFENVYKQGFKLNRDKCSKMMIIRGLVFAQILRDNFSLSLVYTYKSGFGICGRAFIRNVTSQPQIARETYNLVIFDPFWSQHHFLRQQGQWQKLAWAKIKPSCKLSLSKSLKRTLWYTVFFFVNSSVHLCVHFSIKSSWQFVIKVRIIELYLFY